jgi:hypothetical protein
MALSVVLCCGIRIVGGLEVEGKYGSGGECGVGCTLGEGVEAVNLVDLADL